MKSINVSARMNKEWCGLLNVWWCQSDEDMTHMHMTMIGSCISERGVQQGCPSHKGGPRLIQFESPRWRPKTTQVRVHLGVQEQPTMFWSPRPHTESVFDVLHMDGKLRRHTFQCRWSHAKILSESTGIIETNGRPESARALRRRLLGRWPVYHVAAHRGATRG